MSKVGQWSDPFEIESKDADLVLYFAAPTILNRRSLYEEISRHFSKAIIVGCSSSGEVFEENFYDDGACLVAIKFLKTTIRFFEEEIEKTENSYKVGQALAKNLDQNKLQAVLVFSEGKITNGAQLVEGISSILGHKIPLFGGLAGSGHHFDSCVICPNGYPKNNVAVAIGFYGQNLILKNSVYGGWNTFGAQKTVTKAQGSVIYEVDHEPALLLYRRLLENEEGGYVFNGLKYPLSINQPGEEEGTVRTILGVDETQQSLRITSDVKTGSQMHIMYGDLDQLLYGVEEAANNIRVENSSGDKLSLFVSCVGRRHLLGDRVKEEIEMVSKIMGTSYSIIGFYSGGEISRNPKTGRNVLYNETLTLSTLCET